MLSFLSAAIRRGAPVVGLLLLLSAATASAQLNGTYNVGGTGDPYATLEAALTALQSNGVSGPVVFRINAGTYTPPSGGYVLPAIASMSSTNTVTIKPKAGAAVVFDGTISTGVFYFNGGDYYIIDGSNATSGTSRDMKVINRSTSYPVVDFNYGATYNVLKNCNLIGAGTSTSYAIVRLYSGSATTGNSYNVITGNTIGDSTGNIRAACGVYNYGYSTTLLNSGNEFSDNDIINFGSGTSYGYPLYITSYTDDTRIKNNRIACPVKGSWAGTGVYGIYLYSYYSSRDTVAGNRIYDIAPSNPTATVYGIYISSTKDYSTVQITNNMVSVITQGAGTAYGIYQSSSYATTFGIHNNSIYVGGVNAGTATSYSLYLYLSGPTIDCRNNVIVNARQGTSTNNRGLYLSTSSPTNLTLNYNLYFASGSGTVPMSNAGSNYYDIVSWRSATGRDANSLLGDPRFIDPSTGDLHISTSVPTAVESNGTPITTVPLDLDGNTRSTTTPDIGADEGNFTSRLSNDMDAVAIVTPVTGTLVPSNVAFSPSGIVANAGTNTQSAVTVRMRIRNSANNIVYEDIRSTGTLYSGQTSQITFGSTGSVSGTTALTAGDYTTELGIELAGDGRTTGNVITASFSVRDRLNGAYTINPAGSGLSNFRSFTDAVNALSSLGITGPVSFSIAGGTYGSNETFPLRFASIAGASSTNTVLFKPAPGATVLLTGYAGGGILDLDGADYVTFDGSNTVGGTTRDWTIFNYVAAFAVRIINGATYNTMKNMVMSCAGTGTSSAIVYMYTTNTTVGNNYNTFTGNTFGDPAGNVRYYSAFYLYGSSSYPNTGTLIEKNDIINYGIGTSYAYVVYLSSYNQRTKFSGNTISCPTKGSWASGAYLVYYTNSYGLYDTISANRIYDATSSSSSTVYGMYISSLSSTQPSLVIANNMVNLENSVACNMYCIYNSSGSTSYLLNIYNNTFRIGGTNGSSYSSYALYLQSATNVNLRGNIVINERSGTGPYNYLIYRSGTSSGTWSLDYNAYYAPSLGSSQYFGYSSSTITDFPSWRSLGWDANSVWAPIPFVNASNDLHINTVPVFRGESAGSPIAGLTTDFDGQLRDAVRPDIGADEGDFNGGGLQLATPNGGEALTSGYPADVVFTANRTLPVTVQLSLNNGASWSTLSSVPSTLTGLNTVSLTMPDVETNTGRMRVISQRNQYEGDTSDAPFRLVRPVFTMSTPAGGEQLVPTDTFRLRWSNEYLPSALRATLQYSIDGGATWTQIATDITSANLPETNYFDWVVPDAPTANLRLRVGVLGTSFWDVNDAPSTITVKPNVTLLTQSDGSFAFIGEKTLIEWTAVNTERVRLEYSTDRGLTWEPVVSKRLSASLGSFEWTVPNTPTLEALVRVVNNERTRFVDESDVTFGIVQAFIAVAGPNGGENYEMNEPVTVSFNSPYTPLVKLEYSYDGGATWVLINGSVDTRRGTYTFTPEPVPTRRALVRITDVTRPLLSDVSDGYFTIMEAPGLTLYSPTAGEELMTGTIYPISWGSSRVSMINIDYSPSAGAAGTWARIASNVAASQGSINWTVPAQLTRNGRIRLSQVGGPITAESGDFLVVAPVQSVRLIRPNGGESYTAGDDIPVNWTSANVTTVNLSFSSDGGATWQSMVTGLPANQASYTWRAPETPSTQYRVRVESGALSDASDANFEVRRRLVPMLSVVRPNGGESYTVGDATTITWRVADLIGDATVEVSFDNGANWVLVGTTPAATESIDWTVPDQPTSTALVRVSVGSLSDRSDGVFSIARPVVPTLTVLSPNDGSIEWREGTMVQITWGSDAVSTVDIALSTDGGNSWSTTIASDIPAVPGSFNWRVPHLHDTLLISTLVLRVAEGSTGTPADISDAAFSFRPSSLSADAVAGLESFRLFGNFPNPFSGSTEVRWQQPKLDRVSLTILDGAGRAVRTIDGGARESGRQALRIDAGQLPAGVHPYELRVGDLVARGTLVVLR